MLQHEDIAKIEEIKGKFNKIWCSTEYLQAHLNILDFNKTLTPQVYFIKKRKVL